MTYKDPADQRAARQRWKEANPEKHYEQTHRAYRETANAPRGRAPWTQDEDKKVLAHEIPDLQLAAQIQRSLTAIHIRRSRLIKRGENNG